MNVYKFKIFGNEYEARVVRRDEDEIVVSINGQEYKAYLEPTKRQKMAKPSPKITRPLAVPEPGTKITARPGEAKGAGVIKSPLPGLILKVLVKPGDAVKAGDPLIIMEAMKMQNTISATIDGTVERVMVKEGESILEGNELITIRS
jgi:biotin carboxyl carrier protein